MHLLRSFTTYDLSYKTGDTYVRVAVVGVVLPFAEHELTLAPPLFSPKFYSQPSRSFHSGGLAMTWLK